MSAQTSFGEIVVRGARLHNLKNLTVSIPHNQLTVITGVSGSGKSSLAFDTIYAEGQRRYVESLSAYARQFLERMEKPEVDEIDGIAPAIAIRQKNTTRNPRSTVATSTEIYDFMRLLWARAGRTFCPICGRRVEKDTVDQVAQRMLTQPEGERFLVLFPVKHETGQIPKLVLTELRSRGFNRLWQNGTIYEFATPESLLDIDWEQPVYVLADRIAIGPELHQRIVDTVEVCYRESGDAIFHNARTGERQLFSERFMCKHDNLEFREPEPILFSFNSPFGACPRCQGFGNTIDYSLDLIVPNRGLSMNEGAVEPWTKPKGKEWLRGFRQQAAGRVRLDTPFCDLTDEEQRLVLEGDKKKVDGVRQFFNFLETKKYKLHVRVFLSRYRGYAKCPECGGSRLRKEALNARVSDKTIADAVRMNIADALEFFSHLELTTEEAGIAGKILVEIQQRLKFLNDVGLEYLTLDRLSSTLSGGEAQRIQLATCLGSRLVGACYVLDEPSIGLHSRDTARLIRILHELRDLGNTIIVVEHDPDVMRAADHIIDLGPGAGEHGGCITFEGGFPALIADKNGSLTAHYLRREIEVSLPKQRREMNPRKAIRFYGARLHNLKGIDVTIPLRLLTVVTGVSGSGKSTLVHDVVYKSLQARLQHRGGTGGDGPDFEGTEFESDDAPRRSCNRIEGADLVQDVVMIDQTPIGRTPRSNPITYIKGFEIIRGLFAAVPAAEKRGYTAGHFSFNVPGGRCEVCQGDGTVTVEMQFLADVELICDECKGTRFKSSILDIKYKGLNVHEVLQLTVREAIGFFKDTGRLVLRLKLLDEVGLGYLRLGQSATTLSGGEAQRVKLAAHLAQSTNSGTLFIYDEPTTGLHFDDIKKLLGAFERLIDNGGSLLVIEHNLDVIQAADWIIDMGPEGGEAGGRIVAEGTPEQIAATANSHTGHFLRQAAQKTQKPKRR